MRHKRTQGAALLAALALLLVLLAGCAGQNGSAAPGADPASGGNAAPAGSGEGGAQPEEREGPEDGPDGSQEDSQDSQDGPDSQEDLEDQSEDPASGADRPEEGVSPSSGPEAQQPQDDGQAFEPEQASDAQPGPAEAFADGTYTAAVTLEGGSGRAAVESPASLRCQDGKFWATIVWSSSNYDYMKVDGQRYDPVNTEGNSTFEIPVAAFDQKLAVIADTVAMSEPHEVEYTLQFDSASLEKQ